MAQALSSSILEIGFWPAPGIDDSMPRFSATGGGSV
jgi:hypothetical protein